MRYNKNGEALLHRLGQNASFSEVLLTIRYLGYELRSTDKCDFVELDASGVDEFGRTKFNCRTVRLDELTEFLNGEMVSREIIKEEEIEI